MKLNGITNVDLKSWGLEDVLHIYNSGNKLII